MNSYSRVCAAVGLDAVESNMRAIKDSFPPTTSVIGVVKTGGYGYGAVPVTRTIDPYVERYAVAAIDKTVILRRHGIQKMILVLGVTHKSRFGSLVRYDIRPAMFRYGEAGKLPGTAVKSGTKASIHLAVSTGMSRVRMASGEASADEATRVTRPPGIRIEGMFTRFTRANEADKEFYETQYREYRDFCEIPHSGGVDILIRRRSSSAGIVERLDSDGLDMMRAGVSICGLYPSDGVVRNRMKLIPAMELKSVITYIKTIEPGASMSHGGTFMANRPARVATIPAGYRDGYPRDLSNKDAALIQGKRTGILGKVCMDQFIAGVMDTPEAAEGNQVTLIGKDGEECITMEELIRVGGDFHCEIICGIGKRIPRVYLRNGKAIGQKNCFNDIYEGFRYM